MCSNTCKCDPINTSTNIHEDLGQYSCRRCSSTNPFIFIDKSIIECRECFLTSCNKKIRSTIGKSKLLKNKDSVLIAHSGGISSTALLDLIKRSIDFDTKREQKFKVSIIHIDTQSIVADQFSVSDQTRLDNLKSLLNLTREKYPDWNIYYSLVELALHKSATNPFYFEYNSSEEQLETLLAQSDYGARDAVELNCSEMDTSDKIKYYHELVMNLIDKIASHINKIERSTTDQIKFVFSGSSLTQLANNLLVDVILGHGSNIHSTVNICDQRPIVPILRPMRDFNKKEIAYYLKARGIDFPTRISICTMAERKASIQKTTEAFLSKLNVDFPSTYNILLRTGTKMQDCTGISNMQSTICNRIENL